MQKGGTIYRRCFDDRRSFLRVPGFLFTACENPYDKFQVCNVVYRFEVRKSDQMFSKIFTRLISVQMNLHISITLSRYLKDVIEITEPVNFTDVQVSGAFHPLHLIAANLDFASKYLILCFISNNLVNSHQIDPATLTRFEALNPERLAVALEKAYLTNRRQK